MLFSSLFPLGEIHPPWLEVSEKFLQHIVLILKLFLEAIAIFIIAIAALQKVFRLGGKLELVKHQQNWELIRLDLGLSLALSLGFLLAADIVSTAISPSWDAILQLGAITVIRTFLNFFLQKEVSQLETKTRRPLCRPLSSHYNSLQQK